MITALFIPAIAEVRCILLELETLTDDVSDRIIGRLALGQHLVDPEAFLTWSTAGSVEQTTFNERATALLRERSGWSWTPVHAALGDALLIGEPDDNSAWTSVPQYYVDQFDPEGPRPYTQRN